MKAVVVFLLLSIGCAGVILADGIPVDHKTGKVTEPHTVLTLSEAQTDEIDALGTLTLTDEQWRQLRAVGPFCPKRINTIYPVTWKDCTCGGEPCYAIQLSPTEVAIPHYCVTEPVDLYPLDEQDSDLVHSSVELRADRHGQFYSRGLLVPFAQLLKLIDHTRNDLKEEGKKTGGYLSVELPFGLTRDSVTMKSRLDQVYHAAKAAGWKTPDDDRAQQASESAEK